MLKHIYWREVYKGYRKRFNIHPTVLFNGECIIIHSDSNNKNSIIIDEGSVLSYGTHIIATDNFYIKIGKQCHIDTYKKIRTWDMDKRKKTESVKDIIIPDNTFIS